MNMPTPLNIYLFLVLLESPDFACDEIGTRWIWTRMKKRSKSSQERWTVAMHYIGIQHSICARLDIEVGLDLVEWSVCIIGREERCHLRV